jgi:hypothetical protein
MDYTTIKIPVDTHRLIKILAQQSNMQQQELLTKCLKDYETKLFWEQALAKYSEIAATTNNSPGEDESLYDNTLMDGLDDEY